MSLKNCDPHILIGDSKIVDVNRQGIQVVMNIFANQHHSPSSLELQKHTNVLISKYEILGVTIGFETNSLFF